MSNVKTFFSAFNSFDNAILHGCGIMNVGIHGKSSAGMTKAKLDFFGA